MPVLIGALLLASVQTKPPVILAVDTLVVGYRSGSKWLATDHAYGLTLKPMRFYSFGVGTTGGTLEGVRLKDGGDVGGAMIADDEANGTLHLSGIAPKVPRKVRTLPLPNPKYLAVLTSFLKSQGLKTAKPRITKLVQTDLDGDGTMEVLLEGRNRDKVGTLQAQPTKADYSLVLLCTDSKTLLLEFVSFAKTEGAELERLRGIADLDGDGRMEVVTDGQGYEWTNVKLWGYHAGKATKLLENGAGA